VTREEGGNDAQVNGRSSSTAQRRDDDDEEQEPFPRLDPAE